MSQSGQFIPNLLCVLQTLTGDAGGAVGPTTNNIDILGGGGITVTGNPGTSTLTISHDSVLTDSYITDAGTAVPDAAGDLNVLGGTNINTTGAVNTLTVVLDDDVTLAGFLTANDDIRSDTGDIVSLLGAGDFATTVSAGTNLDVGGTVEFTTITDGGLISDASGMVTATAALTTFSGFATWGGAGNYFDDTVLGDFELLRPGTGYIKSVLVAWTASQTVTGMTAGNTYLIYIDDTGTIGKTTTYSQATFDDYIVLFECLRDSTGTNIQYTVKENHPYDFLQAISYYLHETIGTVIENHNQGANITLNGTQKVEMVGADDLSDHGLYTDIPDGGGVPEVWKQMYTNGAGKWATYQSSDTFNGFWNSAGTPTAPAGNKFVIYTLYVSKDNLTVATPTYWAVLDDAEYNNLASAQLVVAGNATQVATAELARLELAQLGFIIYQQSINTIVDVIIEKATVINATSGGAGSSDAALIITNTANFDGILSVTDTTVQVALDTIDEWGKTTTDHAVLIGQGTGTPIISLAVAGNGELIIGSAGADPTVGSITSTDGSLTVTGGAGTLVIEGTDATETQDGVVELATDAEAVDGTDAVRAIVPTSLKAKLGTQTDHGLLVGSGTAAAVTALGVGATGEMLIGNTGADPTWSVTGALTTLNATTVNATTFDTNVAAAAVTLAGTSLIADGTDANIDINITAKGTGHVIIDDLTLTNDLIVDNGGTGASTLTDHGVLVGSGVSAITALAVGTNGQVLVGSTGADPVFATVASADGSIEVTGGAGTIDLSSTGTIGVNNQVGTAYELVLADRGKIVTCTNAGAIDVTIPVNADVALAIGTNVLISQNGAGIVTLVPEGGVTLSSRGALLDTAGQYAIVSVTKIDTNVWICGGDLA